jgi:hypothetical protein
MASTPEKTLSFRPTKDDAKALAYLYRRTGLSFTGVVRLALKRLYDQEVKRK